MNFQKIYEQSKLEEALNLKKALAVGLMGLGLATSAFAKNSSGTFSKNGKSASYEGKDGCAVSMVTTRNRSQGEPLVLKPVPPRGLLMPCGYRVHV